MKVAAIVSVAAVFIVSSGHCEMQVAFSEHDVDAKTLPDFLNVQAIEKRQVYGPMEKTETESGNGNGKRKRKRKTETENGNGKLVMKWKRLHVVSCNNARASYSMLYIALASSVYSLDRTARQDSLKLQPFPCRTS